MATKSFTPPVGEISGNGPVRPALSQTPPPPAPLLPDREAARLLQRLLKSGWQRLSPEYDDPLNMLYDRPATEWTMGWDPADASLYLVLWEKTSWLKQRHWVLCINGQRRYVCKDTPLSPLAGHFRRLLEGDARVFQTPDAFLEPVTDYGIPLEQRELRAEHLLRTLKMVPAAWPVLREPFLSLLGRDLGHDNWPTLDVMKIHRLDQKILLIHCLKALVQEFIIASRQEKHRIHTLIEQVHFEYERLGRVITRLMRPEYEASYRRFRHLISGGFWRIRLMAGEPARNAAPPRF